MMLKSLPLRALSEANALKWHSVDFERRVIQNREARVNGVDGEVKTYYSIRDVIMEPEVELALKTLFEKKNPKEMDYVFMNQAGTPFHPWSVDYYHFKPAQKRSEPRPPPLKHLRHTYATIMLDEGRPMSFVRDMLGHSSIAMIIHHYYDGGSRAWHQSMQ